jgi:hypothetical protein
VHYRCSSRIDSDFDILMIIANQRLSLTARRLKPIGICL